MYSPLLYLINTKLSLHWCAYDQFLRKSNVPSTNETQYKFNIKVHVNEFFFPKKLLEQKMPSFAVISQDSAYSLGSPHTFNLKGYYWKENANRWTSFCWCYLSLFLSRSTLWSVAGGKGGEIKKKKQLSTFFFPRWTASILACAFSCWFSFSFRGQQ